MKEALGLVGFCVGAASFAIAIVLAVYLDLRLHALKQSGDLPESTPQLFGIGWSIISVYQTLDYGLLYSRQYREVDDSTLRFVPVIRVFLPGGLFLVAASILLI